MRRGKARTETALRGVAGGQVLPASGDLLAEVLDRRRAEHRVVATLIERIRSLLDEDRDRVGAELDRLATRLEAHLDYEEQQLVPVLNRMLTMPDGV